MSDLDKLMKKLRTDEPVKAEVVETPKAEVPTPTPAPLPVVAPVTETEDIADDEDDEEDEVAPDDLGGINQEPEKTEPTPANADDPNAIEHEVALLQNDGVFRRELIFVIKELVDVHKVNTQTLLDIKSKLMGEDDGKKN